MSSLFHPMNPISSSLSLSLSLCWCFTCLVLSFKWPCALFPSHRQTQTKPSLIIGSPFTAKSLTRANPRPSLFSLSLDTSCITMSISSISSLSLSLSLALTLARPDDRECEGEHWWPECCWCALAVVCWFMSMSLNGNYSQLRQSQTVIALPVV